MQREFVEGWFCGWYNGWSYQKPHRGHKSPGSDVMRGRRAWRMRGRRLPGAAKGKGNTQQVITWTKAFASACTPPPSPLCTLSACDEINGGLERWGTKLHSAAGISKCNQQEQKSQTEGQGSINDKRPEKTGVTEIIETTELQQFRRKSKIEDLKSQFSCTQAQAHSKCLKTMGKKYYGHRMAVKVTARDVILT